MTDSNDRIPDFLNERKNNEAVYKLVLKNRGS